MNNVINNEEKNVDPRVLVLLELEKGEKFDQDEQSFGLGLLEMHGLITHDLELTQTGIQVYEKFISELDKKTKADE